MKIFSKLIGVFVAITIVAFAANAPATAQQVYKPTEQALKEQQLLDALKPGGTVNGRVSIPDQRAANLIQPEGRDWQTYRRSTLPTVGAIAILGMLALLALFFLVRGRIRLERGFSGRLITRFPSFERFVHWTTASCFIILALSGLNVTFGRALLEPVIGEAGFGTLSHWAKLSHNYLAFPFMLGVALMFLMWVKDNIPGPSDIKWLAAGGGIFKKGEHPPAKRFNAGQKGIFWIVVIGGALMSISGWHLLFPSEGVTEIQFQSKLHGIIAMLFIAAMMAHIYIGTLGMEGAYDAMGTGQVDENWAAEHHSLWLEEQKAKQAQAGKTAPPGAVAAE